MLKVKKDKAGINTKAKVKIVIYKIRIQGSYHKKIVCYCRNFES